MKTPVALLLSLCVCVVLFLAGCGSGLPATPSAQLAATPTQLSFTATVGQTATAQTVTVTNSGKGAANFPAATITGANPSDFAVSANTCGAGSLGPSASCSVAVIFTPTASGTRTATLNLTDAVTVSLSGTAITAASVTLTPASLTFAATIVGQTTPAQVLTISNSGGTAATLGTPALTGANASDFAIVNNTCTTTIAPNATCTFGITFTPIAPGSASATLTLAESSLGVANTLSASLSGSANPANVTLTPASLTFSATPVSQTSASQLLTLSNNGGAPATLATPTITGPNAASFAIANNTCAATLAPNTTCTLSITFTPTAPGTATATLTIGESSFGTLNTYTASLSGSATPADVTISPSSLTFASTAINQTATAQTVTVTNTGGAAATLSTPTLTGSAAIDFAITANNCGTSIAVNSACTLGITFTPTATGTRAATFNIGESSFGASGTLTVALTGTGAAAALGLQGTVLSGTQPVANSTIQLYTVGATGNASAANPMLSSTVTTNAAGNFYLATGSPLALSFTCAHPTDQIYVVATGGNPGLTPSTTNNAALTLVTALGNCNTLTTSSTVTINELTTAAAAWTLAQFASSTSNIGSSSTNATGIHNAMLDTQLLANPSTGAAATIASNLSIEPGKLAALADALNPCTASDGTSACTPLFTAATPSGGTAPKDTFAAALAIVKHPAQNIAAVYALISNTPPYATTFTTAPNDWTLNMSITGGGLAAPTGLGIDANGNIWATSFAGLLSGFTPQGAPLSSSGYGSGKLSEVYGLTIDPSGNIWASNDTGPINTAGWVTKFTPGSAGTFTNIQTFFDNSISYPIAVSADTNGDIFIANNATNDAISSDSNAVTVYTPSGVPLASHGTGLGNGYTLAPVAVAADANHGVWIANSETQTATHVAANGTIISNLTCCGGAGSNGVATDSAGNAWISDFGDSAVTVISSGASGDAVLLSEHPLLATGRIAGPAGVAVDAAQNVFIANNHGDSISELAGINSGLSLGTLLSPPTGFGYPSTTLPALVQSPIALESDTSGNLWVTSNTTNTLVVFFGLAAPTKTPVTPAPVAP